MGAAVGELNTSRDPFAPDYSVYALRSHIETTETASMRREIYTEEHDIFRDAFRKFLEKEVVPHQEEWLQAGIVTRDICKKTGEQGFIAPWLPEQYGGVGADFL